MQSSLDVSVLCNLYRSCQGNLAEIARRIGRSRGAVQRQLTKDGLLKRLRKQTEPVHQADKKNKIEVQRDSNVVGITYYGDEIKTESELLAAAKIDMSLYEIERVVVNNWEVSGKHKTKDGIWKTGNFQIKITLKRKTDEKIALEQLLARIQAASKPITKPYPKYTKPKSKQRRSLEICVMDPHLGMQCFVGDSGQNWSLDECENQYLWSIDYLVEQAKAFGPFEEIVLPFGNDYMHHDNLLHTTTKGTPQPEGMPYYMVYERAIDLSYKIVDRLREVAPVKVLTIPGNHDQVSSFTLGHVLKARYHNDRAVNVDASPSTYKFYHFGTNLLGFDHGHHIKPIRLAAIMAHECRDIWAKTSYREWHLGDQHRKGSSNPVMLEEQGVSVEYLKALTPTNAWHKLKGFSWQQRGSTGFVWDYHSGQLARIYANLDSYTGKPTGEK
jgi:DNA-binding Lrp family transcriptional regulator